MFVTPLMAPARRPRIMPIVTTIYSVMVLKHVTRPLDVNLARLPHVLTFVLRHSIHASTALLILIVPMETSAMVQRLVLPVAHVKLVWLPIAPVKLHSVMRHLTNVLNVYPTVIAMMAWRVQSIPAREVSALQQQMMGCVQLEGRVIHLMDVNTPKLFMPVASGHLPRLKRALLVVIRGVAPQ